MDKIGLQALKKYYNDKILMPPLKAPTIQLQISLNRLTNGTKIKLLEVLKLIDDDCNLVSK